MTGLHPEDIKKANTLLGQLTNLKYAHAQLRTGQLNAKAGNLYLSERLWGEFTQVASAILCEGARQQIAQIRKELLVLGVDASDIEVPEADQAGLSNAEDLVSAWANEADRELENSQ